MTKQENVVAYLKAIIVPIARNPEELNFESYLDSQNDIVVKVHTSDIDAPFLIGRMGITSRSIKQLLQVWSYLHEVRVILQIGEPFREKI